MREKERKNKITGVSTKFIEPTALLIPFMLKKKDEKKTREPKEKKKK